MRAPFPRTAPRGIRRLIADRRGNALIEFSIVLPVLILLGLTGAEFSNYITVKMRVSQMALQLADNAARMGTGTVAGPKTISETDINDAFAGGQLESGGLDLKNHGRVILSDLEPMANPNTTGKYKIVWQRCYGSIAHASGFGTAGQTNLSGIGPAGAQVTAQDYNATMFVEVYYVYQPLFGTQFLPTTTFDETASMSVRDQRDLTQIYNTSGATVASC